MKTAVTSRADLLLVTVNEHETAALIDAFRQATGKHFKPYTRGRRTYRRLGVINQAEIYHAISEMGSGGPGGSQQTVDLAIRDLRPDAIVLVGVAFGVNEQKQKIGDILLSQQLRLYELQRYGSTIELLRGDRPHASPRLINYFSGAKISWQGERVIAGVLMSGEKLVDNIDYRAQLLRYETEAIGGEMEGAGLYVSCNEHKVDWIVIKAICDWADGFKAKGKTARQKKAAKAAAKFVLHALQMAPIVSLDLRQEPHRTAPQAPSIKRSAHSSRSVSVQKRVVNVDLTSLYGLAQALTTPSPSLWAMASYQEVTAAILRMDVRIPQPPKASNVFRVLISSIQEKFQGQIEFAQRNQKQALRFSQSPDAQTRVRITNELANWDASSDYKKWLEWHVENEWHEHILRLPGLVQEENIPLIAQIISRSRDELNDANNEAINKPRSTCLNPTELQKKIYSIDVALRGLYYDKLTELSSNCAIILHPIRRSVLEAPKATAIDLEQVAHYIGTIVGNWVRLQKSLDAEQKIVLWTHVINKCRGYYLAWFDGDAAHRAARHPQDVAITIAREAGVERFVPFGAVWEQGLDTTSTSLDIGLGLYGYGEEDHGRTDMLSQPWGTVDYVFRRPIGEAKVTKSNIELLLDAGRQFGARIFSILVRK